MAHVTNPISGIFSECSIFFIEDSFYTHQSFIARLYILYIIYEIYISICKSPACLNFLILKLETSFLIYKQVPTFLFLWSMMLELILSLLIWFAICFWLFFPLLHGSVFSFHLFMDRIQHWKLFFYFFLRFCLRLFFFFWFDLIWALSNGVQFEYCGFVCLLFVCFFPLKIIMVNSATCTEFWVKPIFLNEVITSV